MNLTDTHTHLYWESFQKDFDQVIQRALDAGVTTIINVGVDVEKSKEALRQVREIKWPSGMIVYSTIGIHPHEAVKYASNGQTLHDRDTFVQKDIEALEQIYISNPKKVVAIGECGLDYLFEINDLHPNQDLPPEQTKVLQKQLFQAQIDLAKKLKLPLIVHCRDDRSKNPNNIEAWDEVIEMTKDHFGIYHCYSGLTQTTNSILQKTNFLISFAGNLTYSKNEYLKDAAKVIPIDRMAVETDCPFLPPQNKRGQRNEPSNVLEIAQLISNLKGISLEEVSHQTTANTARIFAFRSQKP